MNRDWSIASQKATSAIVEGLAFEVIRHFYEHQDPPVRMLRIDYNSALDLTGKQRFDLIDADGKRWEIKTDRKWMHTGNVFIEHLPHSDFDYLLIFAFKPHILTRQQYLEIIADPQFAVKQGGDYLLATGSLVSLHQLEQLATQT